MKIDLTKILLAGLCVLGVSYSVFAQEVQSIQDGAQVLNAPETGEYFQHVRISGPAGAEISPAAEGKFIEPMPAPQYYALQLGKTYRFRLTNIPLMPGVELYPTVEIMDRTHPPIGEELRHAIEVEFTKDDLYAAARGKFVTRIIYIENPETAMPISSKDQLGQGYFDVAATADPVSVAKTLGRPVVRIQIGGRAPNDLENFDPAFLYNCPPFLHYPPAESKAVPPQITEPEPNSEPEEAIDGVQEETEL
ncbi:MAG: hypothetical protein IJQ31_16755 [Thermoguttaceae bacterium]|nr:hypothetical protein [Thermoguttaceae bacterium]